MISLANRAIAHPAVSITGSLTGVGPAIEEGYAAGQKVFLYIEAQAVIIRSWYDPITPLVQFDVFASDNSPLSSARKDYVWWPWQTEIGVNFSFSQAIGYMPESIMRGYVVMSSYYLRQLTELARRNFIVPLKGGNGGDGGGEKIPWKEIAIGAGIVAVGALVIKAVRR